MGLWQGSEVQPERQNYILTSGSNVMLTGAQMTLKSHLSRR